MLRVIPSGSTRPWRTIRFASQLSQNLAEDSLVEATVSNAGGGVRKFSLLSRLSDRTQARIRDPGSEQKNPNTHKTPRRPAATSFVSARSAQKRDHAAEKWFADVRELNISNVDHPDDLKSLPRKRRKSGAPKRHEMRPGTDLNELFAPSTTRSAASLRLQTKKELGGDYASYLPDGHPDPYQLPVAYARLVLGRNKHVHLNAQTSALSVVEEVIQGRTTRRELFR